MTHRFFRTADAVMYEQVRLALDAAWGIEPPETCIRPQNETPRDADGRIVLGVKVEFCEYEAVAAILPGLLASGAVEEISRETYMEVVMRVPGE
jgi:hypothetical protein